MSNPFDLKNQASYRTWRVGRLAAYPAGTVDLRVEVARLAAPSAAEQKRIRQRMAAFNLALVRTGPEQIEPDAILAFGRALGLTTADSNLFADHRAVSTIAPAGADDRAEYIPYTNRPLSWHTDGYYNDAPGQVRAWTLFCLRPAPAGGTNALLDHEIAYILLRDESTEHIRALSHPQALTIPANVQDGRTLRPRSAGPVFSVRNGVLHMRYTARERNVSWRDTPQTHAARAALDRLFSSNPIYTFTHNLQSGEGLISNNVLHNRTGFESRPMSGEGRLLYRVRYLERVEEPHPA